MRFLVVYLVWILGFFAGSISSWSCNSCGQSFSFTPQMLLISAAFFLLPLSLVAFIVWKVWRSDKQTLDKGN